MQFFWYNPYAHIYGEVSEWSNETVLKTVIWVTISGVRIPSSPVYIRQFTMTKLSFTCPYCDKPTTITDPNLYSNWEYLSLEESSLGEVGVKVFAITCPNQDCQKLYLKVVLTNIYSVVGYPAREGKEISSWELLPDSCARSLPDYIPQAIKSDYEEACKIKNLSPKASATLSRRCLQGMIRDFFSDVKPGKLKNEIDSIKDKVDPLIWESIETVRKVGNIGAHMEEDINVIVDVEPNEAQLLIKLIERLIDEWYVARKNRQDQLEEMKKVAEDKENQKKKKVSA